MRRKQLLSLLLLSAVALLSSGCYQYQPQKQIRVAVESSEPIYGTVIRHEPHRVCYEKEVEERVSCGGKERDNGIGVDTIIGATAGVVLGNQFKHHSGAAKVIGGIAGALIANSMRQEGDTCYVKRLKNVCETEYEEVREEVLTGYNNCGTINGEKVCKRHDRKLSSFTVGLSY